MCVNRTRPVYVSTREHSKAHLLVCFIALTMMRLIQRKAKSALAEDAGKDVKWSYSNIFHLLDRRVLV